MPTLLDELADRARRAATEVGPSVVRIGRHGGRGCGIVVAEGLVATNAHNLRDRTTQVTFADGRAEGGVLAGADVEGDLAVLQVPTGDAPPVDLGGAVATGDVVFAVARAAAGGTRVSFGLVSGTERAFRGPRGRRISGGVEHSAPLPRGSSGSPLVDVEGRVVGMSTHRIGDGFYLALPADEELRSRIDALAAGGTRQRVTLGVGLTSPGTSRRLQRSVGLPERDGLLVRAVDPGSPAAVAGVTEGDLLVTADGRALVEIDDLFDVLDQLEPGATLELTVVRGVDERVLTVQFPVDDERTG